MSSLPILNSQTPNNGKVAAAKSGNAAPAADELANGAAPFGELLARQLSPQGRDLKADLLKSLARADNDPLVADPSALAAQQLGDVRTDGVALPSELLAALSQEKRAPLMETATTVENAETDIVGTPDEQTGKRNPLDARTDRTALLAQEARTTGRADMAETAGRNARDIPLAASPFAAALRADTKQDIVLRAASVKGDAPLLSTQTVSSNASSIVGLPQPVPGTAQTTVTQATIATPVGQPQWADDLGQKVTWMATQRTQSAELHLNPAQLGPLEVSLKLNGDQATVQFTSAHAAVRDAIEQSIPRLRDMLADSGISLGNTTVSDQAPREQHQRGQAGGAGSNAFADDTPESGRAQVQSTTLLRRHDGVVDTFA